MLSPNPTDIHQLRVATRRATAALRIAKDHLPPRKRRQTIEMLRDLRRSAGKVRDCDIFFKAVRSTSGVSDTAAAFLTGLRAHRRMLDFNITHGLVAVYLPSLVKLANRLPELVETDLESRYTSLLNQQSRRLFEQLTTALQSAAKTTDADHLHQVRIHAKRLRYMIEMANGDVSRLTPLLTQMESLQEVLGDWHDAHAMKPKLESARAAAASVNGAAGSPVAKGLTALTRSVEKTEAKQLASFRKWLRGWQAFQKRNPGKVLFPKSPIVKSTPLPASGER